MRLLEQSDDEANLENCISLASAIELSSDYTKNFRGNDVPMTESTSVDNSSLCATGKTGNSNAQEGRSKNKCQFCGLRGHPRRNCPARNDACHKCQKKGHWAVACRSQLSALSSELEDESATSTVSSVLLATGNKPAAFYASVKIGKKDFLGLVDSGASESFISLDAASQCDVAITKESSTTRLANQKPLPIIGYIDVTMRVNSETYQTRLKVARNLVADVIIGMDLLGKHAAVHLKTNGNRSPVSFSSGSRASHAAAVFPSLNIEPPVVFSDITKEKAKPVAAKSRYVSPENKQYLTSEITRLLDAGIIEPSSSPWRAQAFVVRRNSKPRMVIDYSETINKYTELDGYPFPDVEDILDGAAKDYYFSRVDLKSAYHQVPLRTCDRPFTAFEANGALYEFTRLAFGLTNAVPVFQRVMDSLIKSEELSKTRAYLDDVIISGATLEEHDRNLDKFLSMTQRYGITLNKDKCLFRVKKISLLGHILENGTKRPDPDRLKTLLEYPTPKTKDELHRLIGFFAYNAKWVQNYSDKMRPLLDAFNNCRFPLCSSTCRAIDSLKEDVSKAVLAIPRPGIPLVMTTDASGTAIGGTLTQNSQPIAFFSRSLSPGERKQSAVEREAMAIVECSRKWLHFMRSFYTIIQTDQKSVSFIFSRDK